MNLGAYCWVSDWSSLPFGSSRVEYAAALAARLKLGALRLPMGYAAVDPFDNMLPDTTPNFLESMARQPDYRVLFSQPYLETHLLTTYTPQAYNQSGDWSGLDLELEYNEYKSLAQYLSLAHPYKGFILLPWETDNEPVTMGNIDDFVAMMKERVRGIQDSGARNVFSAVEFAHTGGLVMPRLAEIRPDFISYAMWEATSPLVSDPDAADLATAIQAKLQTVQTATDYPAERLIVGEIGYHTNTALAPELWVKTIRDTIAGFGCPIAIYWNLLEDGNVEHYGAIDEDGAVRPIGRYLSIFNRAA